MPNLLPFKSKKIIKSSIVIASTILLMSCQQTTSADNDKQQPSLSPQGKLDKLAQELNVRYKFISNLEKYCPDKEGVPVKSCYRAEILLTSPTTNNFTQWQLHYSQVYPTYASTSKDFDITHINGDIHQITPKKSFKGFKEDKTVSLNVWISSSLITESELMPNYWLTPADVTSNIMPRVVESTRTSTDSETGLEVQPYVVAFNHEEHIKSSKNDINEYASAEWLYQDTSTVNKSASDKLTSDELHVASQLPFAIIPTPKTVKVLNKNTRISLQQGVNIDVKNIINIETSEFSAALARLEMLGVKQSEAGLKVYIEQKKDPGNTRTKGAYQLRTQKNGIHITAYNSDGIFYALQSVSSLLNLDELTIPSVLVIDEPRYSYRGQHIDVARNFQTKEMIISLIKQMAAYKLNKLHLHLAEDEAWRLALPSFPELTEIGSKRCMSLDDKQCLQPQLGGAQSPARDGFYSEADYKEILTVATAHHVQVIPSLDMPGHSRAAIKAMEYRYNNLMAEGKEVEAKRYLLTDFEDKTKYSSIQNYNDNTLNICMDSTYTFIDRVLEDLQALHQEANHPLNIYHIGADETAGAWLDSPQCKTMLDDPKNNIKDSEHLTAYFIERVSNMVAMKGITTGGWNDGLSKTNNAKMPVDTYSYVWGALPWGAHKQVSEQAQRGWNIVLSLPDVLYFDFPYLVDPKERGYKWAARTITTQSIFNFMPDNLPIHAEFRVDALGQNFSSDDRFQKDAKGKTTHRPLPENFDITGIQGQLWSETVRSESQANYMIYPRLLALAERAWHQANWQVPYNYNGLLFNKETKHFTQAHKTLRDKKWLEFSQVLGNKELPKLERAEVFYRLPTVGAKIIDEKLHANVAIYGLPIEYKNSGADDWQIYQQPVDVILPIDIRTRTVDGKRAGRTLTLKRMNTTENKEP
jgi:hexosaminidase